MFALTISLYDVVSCTYLIYVPADNIAIIVLSNVSGDTPDKMAAKLLDVTLGKKSHLPSENCRANRENSTLEVYWRLLNLASVGAQNNSVRRWLSR